MGMKCMVGLSCLGSPSLMVFLKTKRVVSKLVFMARLKMPPWLLGRKQEQCCGGEEGKTTRQKTRFWIVFAGAWSLPVCLGWFFGSVQDHAKRTFWWLIYMYIFLFCFSFSTLSFFLCSSFIYFYLIFFSFRFCVQIFYFNLDSFLFWQFSFGLKKI